MFFNNFADMKARHIITLVITALLPLAVCGQNVDAAENSGSGESPTFVPVTSLQKTILDGDSALYYEMSNV